MLNGAKLWITNASIADIAVVWAKDEQGIIRGLIVEKGWKGFTAPETHGKWSLRASVTGELVFLVKISFWLVVGFWQYGNPYKM